MTAETLHAMDVIYQKKDLMGKPVHLSGNPISINTSKKDQTSHGDAEVFSGSWSSSRDKKNVCVCMNMYNIPAKPCRRHYIMLKSRHMGGAGPPILNS